MQDPYKYFHDLILIEIEINGNLIFISSVIMISKLYTLLLAADTGKTAGGGVVARDERRLLHPHHIQTRPRQVQGPVLAQEILI